MSYQYKQNHVTFVFSSRICTNHIVFMYMSNKPFNESCSYLIFSCCYHVNMITIWYTRIATPFQIYSNKPSTLSYKVQWLSEHSWDYMAEIWISPTLSRSSLSHSKRLCVFVDIKQKGKKMKAKRCRQNPIRRVMSVCWMLYSLFRGFIG